MDRTLIWYWPRNRQAAEALALTLSGRVVVRSLKGWSGHVEEPAAVVYADDPVVAAAYRATGADVRTLDGVEVAAPVGDVAPAGDEAAPSLPRGFTVTKAGTWFKVLDAAGNQVGNAKRSEAEAIAQVMEG